MLQSAGDEKLASEYEQFMKMVCTEIPKSEDFSPKAVPIKSTSPSSYHEFNIETNLPEDNNFTFVEHATSEQLENGDGAKVDEQFKSKEIRQNVEKASQIVEDQMSSGSSHVEVQERARGGEEGREKSESEDSRSIPSDWENVRIKVERLSDENSDTREPRKKRRRKKVTSSSESSSTSSSSDSEEDGKRKRRKRKLSNSNDSSYSDSDSSESSSSSSSSDSSSSDDKRKKRRKKKRKAEKRKKKAKRIAKTKKKRRRKVSSDSSNSDSSDDRRKKRVSASKKSKQKREFSEKHDDNEDIIKTIQKSPLGCSSPESERLTRSQTPTKKIKEEAKGESRKRSGEKHDIWSKEQELARKVMSDDSVCSKAHKDEKKRTKADERYMEEWEMDGSIEKMETPEPEKKDERSKEERSKKEERLKEKCSSIGKEMPQGSSKSEEDSDAKKKKKKEKEQRSSNEFLADWEKDSDRISKQKEKWGETEFDTLNVPSLTQLEREVSKRQLLADEWEVDSLEAVPDLTINKRKSRGSKKVEKEVRYDKKTDTYISIEKETSRECKKRQDRLSAMRIWEEEEEEGEREAMMLMEQKSKRKRDEWDIEEEPFLREKSERKEDLEDNICTIDIHKEVNAVSNDMDTPMKLDAVAVKKSKKSRWDIASQSDEKIELKAPVMWEEECAEWTTINKFERKSDKVTLERCDSIIPKTKIKDEDIGIVDQQSRKAMSKSSDLIDLFARKSEDVDLLDSSWTSEELKKNKPRIKGLESSSELDVFFDEAKEPLPMPITKEQTVEQLKDMFDIDVELSNKNIELYSPSSPALSQKSEDMEAFNDSTSNALNLREDLAQDKLKKETLVKSDEESLSVPNIPLQIKYREGKYAKPVVTKEEFEEILGVQAEDQSPQKKYDEIKSSEALIGDLPINEPCPDASNYKPQQMDIFAEYETEEYRGKSSTKSVEVVSSSSAKGEETNESKAALKLIPKQLLIRRNNERVKSKLISDDPIQHAAALLTIQKKLRESNIAKNDEKDISCEESTGEFKIECEKTTITDAPVADVAPKEQTTITDVKVDSRDLSITVKTSITTKTESSSTVKLDFNRIEEYKSTDKEIIKTEELKKPRPPAGKDICDTEAQSRSPSREQRKKSPSKKENEKRIGERSKEKRDKKFDDRDRGDRRDSRGSKDYAESRRRSSPSSSRSRRRRSVSPRTSWERERSRSESHSRSWSRSRSKSPKRKDDSVASSSRDKRQSRIDEGRSGRSRTDDRRERSTRSPPRSNSAPYNKGMSPTLSQTITHLA